MDLSPVLATYLPTIPIDPKVTTLGKTGYTVSVDADNVVTVKACNAENSDTIQVSR